MRSEFQSKFEFCSIPREIREIERIGIINRMTDNLCRPRCRHESLPGELQVECRPEKERITGICVEAHPVVVTEIAEFRSDQDSRNRAKSDRA